MEIKKILDAYRSDANKVKKNDLTLLYNTAKEQYYAGAPIMGDYEFDALEKFIGLENKSYVGTRHNPSYTVEHPFVMGSLAKEQVHEKEGVIDWEKHFNAAKKFFGNSHTIITPKFDGCSYECLVENGKIKSVSSRGDGTWGTDLSKHIGSQLKDAVKNIKGNVVVRGEVLIDKNVFAKKYSEFVNPRSFVAGILGRDIDKVNKSNDTTEKEFVANALNDLSIVIYDTRVMNEGKWVDYDWTNFLRTNFEFGKINKKYLPDFYMPSIKITTAKMFEDVYREFETYRNEDCPFALDGIVYKPIDTARTLNLTEHRPKDCVAIKFTPMLQETTITNIEWNLGKTGEWNPVVITEPVIMDGKSITRASGHNYGYLIDNKLSIGSKIIMSLAGDIIPFIYKITDTKKFSEKKMNLPAEYVIEGCHLMGKLSEEEQAKLAFMSSAGSLNITNLGGAETLNIWNYLCEDNGATDDFFGNTKKELPNNILFLRPEDIYYGIVSATKNGATGKATKIKKAYSELLGQLTLKDIIKSCSFKLCGDKVAEQCANYLLGMSYDFASMASEGYEWVKNKKSPNQKQITKILEHLGKSIEDFKERAVEAVETSSDQIPVILTGEPNDYASKGEFLKCHPEYRLTGKWTEVKIVFTNDLNSNTGKMKKAKEKGIEIRVY